MDINMPTKLPQFQCSVWLCTNGMIYSQGWINKWTGKNWGSVMIYRELHLQKEKNWIKQIGIAPVLKLWSHKKVWIIIIIKSGLVLETKK